MKQKTRKANTIDFIEFPSKSAKSVAKAKAFYGSLFGWSFTDWGDDFVDTSSSGVSAGFNADRSHRPAAPLAVIYVDELEQTHAKVVAAKGRITKPIFSFPGGRRFHFTDPNGNELAVWSDR